MAEYNADSYTVLLLHCNGTNDSTIFTDSETTPKTVTANGSAHIDTSTYKFGGASGKLLDVGGSYLSLDDSVDWAFGTGDFTIDFWLRFNSVPTSWSVLHQGAVLNENRWIIAGDKNLKQIWFRQWTASTLDIDIIVAWTPVANTWYHVALVRNGNNWMWFIDGQQIGTTIVAADAVSNHIAPFYIGADGYTQPPPGGQLNSWIDEFRISKGIARWTGNFIPPSDFIPKIMFI